MRDVTRLQPRPERDRFPEDESFQLIGQLPRSYWERIVNKMDASDDPEDKAVADVLRWSLIRSNAPVFTESDPCSVQGIQRIAHTVRASRGGAL